MCRTLIAAVCSFFVLWASLACLPEKKAPPKGNPEAGRKLFQEQCAFCHSDTRDEERVGPSLKGLFQRDKLPRRGIPVTEENVRRAIEAGANPPGIPPMPAYREILKPNEIDDLVVFLKSLPYQLPEQKSTNRIQRESSRFSLLTSDR